MSVKLANAGLTPNDIKSVAPLLNAVYAAAGETGRTISAIYAASRGHALTSSSRHEVKTLRNEFHKFALQTYFQMLSRVSQPERLRRHIQDIKRHMKAYALPEMPNDAYHKHN
jgi:hypothetical protein